MSGFYNNWFKVNNPSSPNDIPPMESGGYQPPFFFGGSQVPVNLGLKHTDISGGGYSKVNFLPDVTEVIPDFLHAPPALTAAFAGISC